MAKSSNPNLIYPRSAAVTGHFLSFYAYDYNKAQSLGVKSIRDMLSGASMHGNDQLKKEMQNLPETRDANAIQRNRNRKEFFTNAATKLGFKNDKNGNPITWSRGSDTPSNTSIGCVKLYIPDTLQYDYSAEWNKVSFGAIGAAFGGAGNAIGAGAATAFESTLGELQKDLAAKAPGSEGVDTNAILGGAFGITYNDNALQTFQKMGIRSFKFTYVLVTRNEKEEKEIKDIIKFFKLAMHPGSRRSGTNNSLFLTYPYIFRIIQSGTKSSRGSSGIGFQFLPNTKYCALKDFKVDYTPANNVSLTPNSFVTAVKIDLGFEELTTLTRQDIHDVEDTATEENWGWTEGNKVTDNTGERLDRQRDNFLANIK